MKVLHVVDSIDASQGGGMAERTFQLALALHRANVTCTVLCTDMGLSEKRRDELQGIKLIAVPILFRRFLVPWISLRRVVALVADADIVHVTGHWSLLGALVCLIAQRLGKPYVYCPAGSLRIFGRSSGLKRLYNSWAGRRIVAAASRCLAVTELERVQFNEYGVHDGRIVVLPNGVHAASGNAAMPDAFKKYYGLEGKSIVLFLGRLSPIKGPDMLLAAFEGIARQLPAVQLVFAGPDSELGRGLKFKVARAGLSDRVLFTGFLAGQGKQDALAAADLLVVPSRHEAMSLVALEAGLHATPVLLTDQCGFDEVQFVGGGAVVAANERALAAGMQEMLKDPEQLIGMGLRLQALVLSRYTWDGLTQRALELYAALIRESRN